MGSGGGLTALMEAMQTIEVGYDKLMKALPSTGPLASQAIVTLRNSILPLLQSMSGAGAGGGSEPGMPPPPPSQGSGPMSGG